MRRVQSLLFFLHTFFFLHFLSSVALFKGDVAMALSEGVKICATISNAHMRYNRGKGTSHRGLYHLYGPIIDTLFWMRSSTVPMVPS